MSLNYLQEVSDPDARRKALTSSCLTLSISGEDHTLGNALRAMLNRNLKVQFAGYCIPHPTQTDMNFRLQTTSPNYKALDVLDEALDNLSNLTQHVRDTFSRALIDYEDSHAMQADNAQKDQN